MNDVMVTIRLPESLLRELKGSAEKNHFLDLSEHVRSIIRKKWMKATKQDLMGQP